MPHYRFATTCIASDIALPELPAASATAAVDWTLRAASAPTFAADGADWYHEWCDPRGHVTLVGARCGERYAMRVPGIGDALADGSEVRVWRDPCASVESLRHALLDQILPRLLAQRGALVLHGAAVVVDADHSLVIVGESGYGKSTLTAAFAKTHRVLTDDCLLLQVDGTRVQALPTYPGLRLLPDALAALYGADAPLTEAVAHYTDKRRLALPAATVAAPPVAAIMILQPPPTAGDIHIAPLPSGAAAMALVAQTFQFDLGDMSAMARLLARCAGVVERVPLSTLAYPRDFVLLPTLVERLCTATPG